MREASRPEGVWHRSPGRALHVGTTERATRARGAAAWAVVPSSGSGPDTVRPARPGTSGTIPRARARGRSSATGVWLARRRAEVDVVRAHRADPEARRRRPGGDPCQPWRFGRRTGESSASTPRPLDPHRPYSDHHGCTLCFAAICRVFVPIRERRSTLVTPQTFHGKEGVVGSSPTEGFTCNSWVFWHRGDGRSRVCASTSRPKCVHLGRGRQTRIARICGMARVVDHFRPAVRSCPLDARQSWRARGIAVEAAGRGLEARPLRAGRGRASSGSAVMPATSPTNDDEGDVGPSAARPTWARARLPAATPSPTGEAERRKPRARSREGWRSRRAKRCQAGERTGRPRVWASVIIRWS